MPEYKTIEPCQTSCPPYPCPVGTVFVPSVSIARCVCHTCRKEPSFLDKAWGSANKINLITSLKIGMTAICAIKGVKTIGQAIQELKKGKKKNAVIHAVEGIALVAITTIFIKNW